MKLTYFILFLTYCSLNAQNITISEEISNFTYDQYEILPNLADNTLVALSSQDKIQIIGFNKNFYKVWEREIEFDTKNIRIQRIVKQPRNDRFSVLYSFRKKGINHLIKEDFNAQAYSIKTDTLISQKVKNFDFRFDTELSEDFSKLLFVENNGFSKPKNAFVLDLTTNEIVLQTTLPQTESHIEVEYTFVSNEGDIYKIYQSPTFSKKNNKIIHFSNTGFKHIEFKFPDFIAQNMLPSFDEKNNKVVLGGVCSLSNRSYSSHSYICIFSTDLTKIEKLVYTPFSAKFLLKYSNKRKKPKKGISDAMIRSIIHRKDGGVLLIGEEESIYLRSGNSGGNTNQIIPISEYKNDEIFICSYNQNGALDWQDVYPKKQSSVDDQAAFSSFFLMETANHLKLIFNDEIKYNTNVNEYIIKGNGAFIRNSVMSTDEVDLKIRFRDGIQVSSSTAIFPSEFKNRIKLVKISY